MKEKISNVKFLEIDDAFMFKIGNILNKSLDCLVFEKDN